MSDDVIALLGLVEENQRTMKDNQAAMMGLLRSFERQNETLEKFLLALPNGRSDWQFDIERHPGGTIKAVKAKRENEVMN